MAFWMVMGAASAAPGCDAGGCGTSQTGLATPARECEDFLCGKNGSAITGLAVALTSASSVTVTVPGLAPIGPDAVVALGPTCDTDWVCGSNGTSATGRAAGIAPIRGGDVCAVTECGLNGADLTRLVRPIGVVLWVERSTPVVGMPHNGTSATGVAAAPAGRVECDDWLCSNGTSATGLTAPVTRAASVDLPAVVGRSGLVPTDSRGESRLRPDCPDWGCGTNGTSPTGLAAPVTRASSVELPGLPLDRSGPVPTDSRGQSRADCPDWGCSNGTSATGLSTPVTRPVTVELPVHPPVAGVREG